MWFSPWSSDEIVTLKCMTYIFLNFLEFSEKKQVDIKSSKYSLPALVDSQLMLESLKYFLFYSSLQILALHMLQKMVLFALNQ